MAEPLNSVDRAAENGRRAAELYARMNGVETKGTEDARKAMSEHFLLMNDPSYAAAYRQQRKPALDATRGLPPTTTMEQAKAVRDKHFEKLDEAAHKNLDRQRTESRIYRTPSEEQQANMMSGLGYGALAGGGLGLLYEALRSKTPQEKKQKFLQKALRYAAKGGIGALVGGAIGRRVGGSMALTKTAAGAGKLKVLADFFRTPAQAGQAAMLSARRSLKPLSPYAPKGVLANPGNKLFSTPYAPRREVLKAVGQNAARAQLKNQLGIGTLTGMGISGAYGYGPFANPAVVRDRAMSQQNGEMERMRRLFNNAAPPAMQKANAAREFGEKVAAYVDPAFIAPLAGMTLGGTIGALSSRKNWLRNMLIGAGVGGAGGGAAEYFLPGLGLGGKYTVQDALSAMRRGAGGKEPGVLDSLMAGGGRLAEMGAYAARRRSLLPGLELGYLPGHMKNAPEVHSGNALRQSQKILEPATQAISEAGKKITEAVPQNVRDSASSAATTAKDTAQKGMTAFNNWWNSGKKEKKVEQK